MADEATAISETPKKASKGPSKAKKVKPTASHPKISVMVNEAIEDLKERGGSSLQAIKKYIAANYKVDIDRMAPFIKKYLKTAVTTGELVQTKGKGASGSFKLKGAAGKAEASTRSAKTTKKPKPASPVKKAAKPAKKTSVKKVTKKPKAEKKSKPAKSPKKPKAKAAAKSKPKPKKTTKPAPKKAPAKRGKK